MKLLRYGPFLALLVWFFLFAGTALAQRVTVEGEVTLEDGSVVDGAAIHVLTETGDRPVAQGKTKKKGTFRLIFFPPGDTGRYRFRATKEGLLIGSMQIELLDSDRQPVDTIDMEVGPVQTLPSFTLSQNEGAVVKFVMVPKSHFAEFLAVPGNARATELLAEANRLSGAGKYAESSKLLRQIVDDGIEQATVYYLLGRNALGLNETEEGAAWFEKTRALDDSLPGVHGQLAAVARKNGDHERALELYAKEIEISPDDTPTALNRGTLLREMGRTDEAEQVFEALIAAKPEEVAGYAELAILYLQTEQRDKAGEVLARMEEMGGGDPVLWFNLGANFSNQGQYDQAEMAYRKSLAIDVNFADSIRELGYLQIRQGRKKEALDFFDQYLELRPGAADAAQVQAVREALIKSGGG